MILVSSLFKYVNAEDFSLGRCVCHTNWLCLPLAATAFSRERPCLNLPLDNSALANSFRKKCTYCYWKAADTKLWRSFVQSLSFPLLFLSPLKYTQASLAHQTHRHTKHNKRLIFWKIVFALSFCYVWIRQGQRKEADRSKIKRDREKKGGEKGGGRGSQYPLGSSLLCPLALVVDAAKVGHDDRDRQGNYQHPTQRAYGPKHLPNDCFWHHITVPATWTTNRNVSTQGGKTRENIIPFKEFAPQACFIMLSRCVFNVIFTSLEIVPVTLDYFTTSNKKSHIWSGWGINRTFVKSLLPGLLSACHHDVALLKPCFIYNYTPAGTS